MERLQQFVPIDVFLSFPFFFFYSYVIFFFLSSYLIFFFLSIYIRRIGGTREGFSDIGSPRLITITGTARPRIMNNNISRETANYFEFFFFRFSRRFAFCVTNTRCFDSHTGNVQTNNIRYILHLFLSTINPLPEILFRKSIKSPIGYFFIFLPDTLGVLL